MEKPAKRCQSCGMPLKKDTDRGSNSDGSLSVKYCHLCYADGAFFQPDFTMDQMRDFIIERMHEQGSPKFLARFFASGLGKLERWSGK
jgi:hypothetical protein